MTVKAQRELDAEISADDFQALEQKVYQTVEMLKAARAAQQAAERDNRRLREQFEHRDDEFDGLRAEVIALRKEREEVRGRVEKLLKQIDQLTAE
jgi:chromosome segregation ATPase